MRRCRRSQAAQVKWLGGTCGGQQTVRAAGVAWVSLTLIMLLGVYCSHKINISYYNSFFGDEPGDNRPRGRHLDAVAGR